MPTTFYLDHNKTQMENKEMLKTSQIGDIAQGHYTWIKIGNDQWQQVI